MNMFQIVIYYNKIINNLIIYTDYNYKILI